MLKKIESFVKKELSKDFSGHDFEHCVRVANNARQILKYENGDETIVITACLLHDVVDEKLFSDLDKQISKIKKLLKSENYSIFQIDEIIHIITSISFHLGIKQTSINAMIVQDADRLDALGALGIIRSIQYGQSKKRPFYDKTNLKLVNNHYQFNEVSNSTLSHFYEKLLKLKDLMNTEIAKRIAEERTKTLKDFLNAFYSELSYNEVQND